MRPMIRNIALTMTSMSLALSLGSIAVAASATAPGETDHHGPAPAAGGPLFAAPFLAFEAGSWTNALTIGDVNGDRKPDLVLPLTGAAGVSVLLGHGDGTFGTSHDFGTGGSICVAIGDFNRDGRADLVTGGAAISVLPGNGDGTFGPGYDNATAATRVAVGDLNRDGKLDVVTIGSVTDAVSVLLGHGDGTLAAKVDYATGTSPTFLLVADINRDGRLDVVTANSGSASVSVLLGKGNGTLAGKTDFDAGGPAGWLGIGDANGDSKLDLVVDVSVGGNIGLLLGNGDGSFQPALDTGAYGPYPKLRDLNGDGKIDLVTAVAVALGRGDGTFGPQTRYRVGTTISTFVYRILGMEVADLNRDGRPDVVATDNAGEAMVLMGNGDGTLGKKSDAFATGASSAPPNSLVLGDLNGDHTPDLVADQWVLLGMGDGTFRPGIATGSPYVMAIADLNHDGKGDLISPYVAQLGNGDGTFGLAIPTGAPDPGDPALVDGAVADLNADSKPDLVTVDDLLVTVQLGNGDGTFAAGVSYPPVISEAFRVAIGDLNDDGKPDLVIGGVGVAALLGNGDGTFAPAVATNQLVFAYALLVGDLNGDRKPDVVVADVSQAIWMLPGNGDGTFGPRINLGLRGGTASQYPNSMTIGDLDGDGRLDLAIVNGATTGVAVLLGQPDGTMGTRIDYGTGLGDYVVANGDLNGDGKPELVIGNIIQQTTVSVLTNIGPDLRVPIMFEFHPDSVHLGSNRDWVTGTLQAPAPYRASDIDVASIRLNGVVPAGPGHHVFGDDCGNRELTVSFAWKDVKATLQPGRHVQVTIAGTIAGRPFSGTDFITVF